MFGCPEPQERECKPERKRPRYGRALLESFGVAAFAFAVLQTCNRPATRCKRVAGFNPKATIKMANTQTLQIPSYLRVVGGTDFTGAEQPTFQQLDHQDAGQVGEYHAIRLGEVKGSKGVLDIISMSGGWVSLDGCVPADVAIALMNTYAELRVQA